MASRVTHTRRTVPNQLRGAAANAESLLPLESRQLFSIDSLLAGAGLLASLSTTASTAAITLPDRRQAFGGPFGRSSGGTSLLDGGGGPIFTSSSAPARSLMRLDAFAADPRFTQVRGQGFSSVVIDTGINRSHSYFGPDVNGDGFSDRIIYQYDFADNDADASDRDGHGSNVASIVASSDAVNPGVAPAAGIIALKAFSDNGAGNFGSVERALQWTITNAARYNIASVNLSLGDDGNYQLQGGRYGIADELATLAAMNVIVVAAAGNSFHRYQAMGVSYPASDPSILAVGAVYSGNVGGFTYGDGAQAFSSGADVLTPFTQRSTSIPEIFAPGAPIPGAGLGTSVVTMHGTSQASPQIAGVAVLAQQIAGTYLGRRLSPSEFSSLILAAGASIVDGDNENDNVANTGASYRRVDVLALGQAIIDLATPTPPPPVNHAPTLDSVATLFGGRPNRAARISYALLAAASNEADPDGDVVRFKVASVSGGYLFKGNVPVVAGQTSIGPGESFIWIPPVNQTGRVEAFGIVATDGQADSSAAVPVRIDIGSRLSLRRPSSQADSVESGDSGVAPAAPQRGVFLSVPASRVGPSAPAEDALAPFPRTPTDLAERFMDDRAGPDLFRSLAA